MRPTRLGRSAIVLKPSPILSFHRTLVKRKYRLLFTPKTRGKSGPIVCRMFNSIIGGSASPQYLSSGNDPLFRFYRWIANLRILEMTEVKTVPYASLSHPFVERMICTVRREFLDHVPFWSARDLERKLNLFKEYYNGTVLTGGSEAQFLIQNRRTSIKRLLAWTNTCGIPAVVVCISCQQRRE